MLPRTLLVAAGIIVLLAGTNVAYATPPQQLALTLTGGIISSGDQQYSVSGGHVVGGYIFGSPVDNTNAVLHYNLTAAVSGLAVTGVARFSILVHGPNGGQTDVEGVATLDGTIDSTTVAEAFPLVPPCTIGSDCTSAIPAVFVGDASVTVSDGVTTTPMTLHMTFESPFLNPFGGPIFMVSDLGEIYLVADYSQARVAWSGIQLGGTVSDTPSGNPVGFFGMTVTATEDLRGGYEIDRGAIAFFGMSNPGLDAIGTFSGRSTIPAGWACSPYPPGFPPGTCTLTGFDSKGVFSQSTFAGGSIQGKYHTSWIVPAVAFSSTVTATLK